MALTRSFCFTEVGYMVDNTCRCVTVAQTKVGVMDKDCNKNVCGLGGYFRLGSDLLDANGSSDEEKNSGGDEEDYLERRHAEGHVAAVGAWVAEDACQGKTQHGKLCGACMKRRKQRNCGYANTEWPSNSQRPSERRRVALVLLLRLEHGFIHVGACGRR
jgi:hypothetical protein